MPFGFGGPPRKPVSRRKAEQHAAQHERKCWDYFYKAEAANEPAKQARLFAEAEFHAAQADMYRSFLP